MTTFLAIAVALALGFAAGYWLVVPKRRFVEQLERRSRVVYELAEGDVENVAHELEGIAESEPSDSTVFLALAALDRRRGRTERAKAIHRTVLASATLPTEQKVAALVGLGRDLLAQGKERSAVGALVRAVSLAPRSAATLETLARALEEAGAWERAAAAWERHEKLVEGRRRRVSRIGRGHALAGQALEALADGDVRKAHKLAERATELAPDSGHVWLARARVDAQAAPEEDALEAWLRAWEANPVGSPLVASEAWEWAKERDCTAAMTERMRATLRGTRSAELIVGLADFVADSDRDGAVAALERVAEDNPAASLALVRLQLGAGQIERARDVANAKIGTGQLVCRVCGSTQSHFVFRCRACGAWDACSTVGAGNLPAAPTTGSVRAQEGSPPSRTPQSPAG